MIARLIMGGAATVVGLGMAAWGLAGGGFGPIVVGAALASAGIAWAVSGGDR